MPAVDSTETEDQIEGMKQLASARICDRHSIQYITDKLEKQSNELNPVPEVGEFITEITSKMDAFDAESSLFQSGCGFDQRMKAKTLCQLRAELSRE